jgi:hypothetical protein
VWHALPSAGVPVEEAVERELGLGRDHLDAVARPGGSEQALSLTYCILTALTGQLCFSHLSGSMPGNRGSEGRARRRLARRYG